MADNPTIIPLTAEQVPTVLSYDLTTKQYIIGNEARALGLIGRTNTFNFKPDLGDGDASFSEKKKYWIVPKLEYTEKGKLATVDTRVLTAKEATIYFLQELLKDVKMPSEIIIGEPSERDAVWKENFRRHMREILGEVYGIKPQFLPEPFAVFQYYRHYEQVFSAESKPEVVLIIDIGGGTFNSCMIATTEAGALSRGGAKSVPYGLHAEFCGGSLIDKELLEIVIQRAKAKGIRWKDDPVSRVEHSTIPILLHIEDAKIALSNGIGTSARVAEDFSAVCATVQLEKGSLHPDVEINVELTGEDLKIIIRKMWRRHWGNIITKTVTEAKKKLAFDYIDKVLVAGGSSQLPFMLEEVHLPLRSLVSQDKIYFGSDRGNAVAFGIACECKEQVRKYPNLSSGNVASCLLNDLYIGFRKTRRDPIIAPKKVKCPDGTLSKIGQLLSSPFETDDFSATYKIELPFDLESRIFYAFSEEPFTETAGERTLLNFNNDVVSIKPGMKFNKKFDLTIEFKQGGNIKPTFHLTPMGKKAEPERLDCAEFYVENLRAKEGQEFLGIDFGNSNSYVVRFLCVPEEVQASDYPEYQVNKNVMDKLRKLETDITSVRNSGLLSHDFLQQYAKDHILVNVFHSNKIEGNPLTKGETELFILSGDKQPTSLSEREARNLIDAYNWVIDDVNYMNQDPEGFIRNINKMILDGIKEGGGQYRPSKVTIAGMNFVPPPPLSVPPLMQSLGQELKKGVDGRSAIEFAVSMHTKLVSIHPFIDANGRSARLLLNAVLMANNLPVVVINFDDKQRYLDALSNSNKGDISALIEFIIECFQQQLDEIRSKLVKVAAPIEAFTPSSDARNEDPIKDAFIEIGLPIADDPLKLVMAEQIQKMNMLREAEYESWKQAFSTLLFESRSIKEEFNNAYRIHGFQMNVYEYDMLSFDKYCDILQEKKVSKTWFLSVQIENPHSQIKVLLFFEHSGNRNPKINLHKIVLTLVRFDGSTYQRLMSEPITLREVGFKDGQLLFLNASGQQIQDSTTKILRTLFAELIRSYVRIE